MIKVLVAEDDAFLSSLLVRGLVAEKFDARAAYDGVQAIEQTKSWHPELILLDILMPTKDGFEVLEELRADPDVAKTRIIVLSNLSEPQNMDRVEKLGVTDYMIKADTTPHEVVAKVKSFFA